MSCRSYQYMRGRSFFVGESRIGKYEFSRMVLDGFKLFFCPLVVMGSTVVNSNLAWIVLMKCIGTF